MASGPHAARCSGKGRSFLAGDPGTRKEIDGTWMARFVGNIPGFMMYIQLGFTGSLLSFLAKKIRWVVHASKHPLENRLKLMAVATKSTALRRLHVLRELRWDQSGDPKLFWRPSLTSPQLVVNLSIWGDIYEGNVLGALFVQCWELQKRGYLKPNLKRNYSYPNCNSQSTKTKILFEHLDCFGSVMFFQKSVDWIVVWGTRISCLPGCA